MDKCWLKAIFVVVRKCWKDRKHPISLFVIENASFIVCCDFRGQLESCNPKKKTKNKNPSLLFKNLSHLQERL